MSLPPTLIQRTLILLWAVVAGVLVWLIFTGSTAHPVAGAIATAVTGVAAVWISSGTFGHRERWAVRLQANVIGTAVIVVIASEGTAPLAGAGLFVLIVALLFLHVAHVLAQALARIQAGLITTRAIARVEGLRQALFYATFAAPLIIVFSPNVIGAAFVVVSCALVSRLASRRITRRHAAVETELTGAD